MVGRGPHLTEHAQPWDGPLCEPALHSNTVLSMGSQQRFRPCPGKFHLTGISTQASSAHVNKPYIGEGTQACADGCISAQILTQNAPMELNQKKGMSASS